MTPSLLNPWFLLGMVTLVGVVRLAPASHRTTTSAVGTLLLLGIASPISLLLVVTVFAVVVWPTVVLGARWNTSEDAGRERVLFWLAVAVLVALLVAFKFAQREAANSASLVRVSEIFGFSYFLFRAINFLTIQHLTRLVEKRPLRLLFYFAFPATFTSGPIQKYLDFREQTEAGQKFEPGQLREAAYRIVRGFFRKLALAFTLDGVVAHYLALPELSFANAVLIVAALYLFFYFDFAGYSDIAIGLGLAMGIRVPENFRRPFTASSLTEFWRNWHISLVDWLREHVFIPLGGMRANRVKSGALALLIMLLCGLWHGITIPFLLWGLWHGINMQIESLMGMRPVPRTSQRGLRYWSQVAFTNVRVALGAVFFLPSSEDIYRVVQGLLP